MKINLILIIICIMTSIAGCSQNRNPSTEKDVALNVNILNEEWHNQETTKNFIQNLENFPMIKDTAEFISTLKREYNLKTDNFGNMPEQITTFRKIKLYGSNDEFFFIEYDYLDGCMAAYPWKYQLVINTKGELIKTFSGERYDFIQIFPDQNPFLLILYTTSKGNGGHWIYKISADTLENVYEGYYNYEVRTYDSHDDFAIYEPFELKLIIKDYNSDRFNDIAFVGTMIYTQELIQDSIWVDNNYSLENPYKKIPVEFIFLYDKKTGHFKAKEDYVKKYRLFD